MNEFSRPTIIISKCLGFANCRFNSIKIVSKFVDSLKPFVDFKTVCPELEIGLGVPRKPIYLVVKNGKLNLIQPETNINLTQRILSFADSFLNSLPEVDGFILKSRSPSFGVRDTKVYPDVEQGPVVKKDAGIFGKRVKDFYSNYPIEDEYRLRNFRTRDHFLNNIYTLANYRQVKKDRKMKNLIEFHTRNKYLLMAYNQKRYRELGKIVSNLEKKNINQVLAEYEKTLHLVFTRAPRSSSNKNVMMHFLGYFSARLTNKEKKFFLKTLENYRQGIEPIGASKNIIKSWIVRFEQDYLDKQTFLYPYPEKLMDTEGVYYCKEKDCSS